MHIYILRILKGAIQIWFIMLLAGCNGQSADSASGGEAGLLSDMSVNSTIVQLTEAPRITNLPECETSNPEVRFITGIEDFAYINDPGYRIFCVEPGDYSAAGLGLTSSGDQDNPRVIRLFDPENPLGDIHPAIAPEEKRAVFSQIALIGAHHWIIHELTLRGSDETPHNLLQIAAESQHNIINRLLVENGKGSMVKVFGHNTNYNTIQNSVIRKSINEAYTDHNCVSINSGDTDGIIVGTQIIFNEIYDCTDGVVLQPEERLYPETVISNNEFYISPGLYTDCSGNHDRTGACSGTENGIEVKSGSNGASGRISITGNRFWGFRVTDEAVGGGGSSGAAINIGYDSAYILLKDNIIFDSSMGIVVHSGSHISVLDNLLYTIYNYSPDTLVGTAVTARGSNHEMYNNIIIDSERWVVADASASDYRCNVVINGGVYHNPIIDGVTADYNAYYNSSELALPGTHDVVRMDVTQTNDAERCFLRKRWTGPEKVCVPYAEVLGDVGSYVSCDPYLGARTNIGVDDLLL